MTVNKRILSIFLSIAVALVTWPLDACKKSEPVVTRSGQATQQAPAATYAAPTADQLYQLVAPIALFPETWLRMVLAASTYPDQVSAAYPGCSRTPASKASN